MTCMSGLYMAQITALNTWAADPADPLSPFLNPARPDSRHGLALIWQVVTGLYLKKIFKFL